MFTNLMRAKFTVFFLTSLILFSGCQDESSADSPPLDPAEDAELPLKSEAAAEVETEARGAKADSGSLIPVIEGDSVLELTHGKPFSYTIQATNDPLGYAVTNPPAWLKREGNLLKGQPSESGEFDLVLRALNRAGASQPFKLKMIVSHDQPVE